MNNLTQTELQVLQYALGWVNQDTFESDFLEYPSIWENSFGSLSLDEAVQIHQKLLTKLKLATNNTIHKETVAVAQDGLIELEE